MNPNTLLLPTVWPRAEPTTVARCVLLALLAHVWLVLTLGNAPGGTAQPGEGVWGAVNVTLRGPETPGATEPGPPPEPAVATGPAGLAEAPRWGGAVRSQEPTDLPPEPGAAQLGTWAPVPEPVAAQPALAPLSRALTLPPALPATPQAGPLPEPGRAVEEPAPAPVPPVPQAPLLPMQLPPSAAMAPMAVAPLAPTNSAAATPGRLPDLLAPGAAPLMAPRVAPPPTPARVAALPSSQPMAAPVALPLAAPALAAAVIGPASPTSPTVAVPALAAVPAPAGLPTGGAQTPAMAAAADAGTRLGHDVAGAPALPASAPPRLNLQLARPRGGEISRGLGGGVLAVLPRPPDVDEKLGQQIAKTAKVDCRTAYAGAGILAVVPLAVETLRKDSRCKW